VFDGTVFDGTVFDGAGRRSEFQQPRLHVERDFFSGLFGDDDRRPEEQEPTPCDPDDNGSPEKRIQPQECHAWRPAFSKLKLIDQ
jgi:hypothetical protein